MKFFVAFALLVAVAAAAEEPIRILRSEFNENPHGGYTVNVETENGIRINTAGKLKKGEEGDVVITEGSFSYVSPDDGKTYTISYIADEFGYRVAGSHLPVAPVDPHHH